MGPRHSRPAYTPGEKGGMEPLRPSLRGAPGTGPALPGKEGDPGEFELFLDDLLSDVPGGRWARVFGTESPLRIEIGVGNSDFLIQVALREPAFSYLGFEYSPKRVAKFLKKVRAWRIGNIRVLKVNAIRALVDLVEPGSVDRFYINFPDPWPKRRHSKFRLIQPPAAELFARLLAPGGGISLRSDSPAYAAQMLACLDGVRDLVNLSGRGSFASCPRDEISTPYEVKFKEEGRSIHYLEYRKRNGGRDLDP